MLPQSKPAEVPPELADGYTPRNMHDVRNKLNAVAAIDELHAGAMELAAQRARPLHNPMREHSSECESTLHRTVPQPLPI